MRHPLFLGTLVVLALIAGLSAVFRPGTTSPTDSPSPSLTASASPQATTPSPSPTPAATATPAPSASLSTSALFTPVADFKARITKKRFGTYITPATSPVQPERFMGYHTGVDVEYADQPGDTQVRAIAGGQVTRAGTVSGYGGVVIIRSEITGSQRLVVYGHLDPDRLPALGATLKAGEQFAYLGDDKSSQTDGERKHLHLSILKGTQENLRGYVQDTAELSSWLDPETLEWKD